MEWTWMEEPAKLPPKKWKLYRAVYNHYGLLYIESSWPKERFEQEAARGYGIRYIIGVRVKRNRHYIIEPMVEGPEEALRYILELIEEDEKIKKTLKSRGTEENAAGG